MGITVGNYIAFPASSKTAHDTVGIALFPDIFPKEVKGECIFHYLQGTGVRKRFIPEGADSCHIVHLRRRNPSLSFSLTRNKNAFFPFFLLRKMLCEKIGKTPLFLTVNLHIASYCYT